jgi:predicted transcriptional regulator
LAKASVDEDRLSDLHFQLSNADRRRIVEELLKENLKLNEVAKKLDITPTEAFRQLQRLTDAGLLEKIPRCFLPPFFKLTISETNCLCLAHGKRKCPAF